MNDEEQHDAMHDSFKLRGRTHFSGGNLLNTYHSKPDLPQHIRNVTPGHCLVAFRFQDNKNLSCVSYERVLCVITHKTKMCG